MTLNLWSWNKERQASFLRKEIAELETRLSALQNERVDLLEQRDELQSEVRQLKESLADMKRTKKLEDDEIKHRMKCFEETVQLEKKAALMDKDIDCAKKISEAERKYQSKVTDSLEKRGSEIKDMYEQILTRLPNVNWEVSERRK